MEAQKYHLVITFCLIIIFGITSFVLCVVAELKRSKKKDLRLDGRWCYLPGSDAFACGLAALVLLSIAQIIGNLILCRNCCCSSKETTVNKFTTHIIPNIFLSLSWMSFGSGVILLSGATSMNQKQGFGEGWLDGECYIVKDGVFIGCGILVILTLTSTLVAGILRLNETKVEQGQKVHDDAQLVESSTHEDTTI